ncbi:hypothetical protein [Streptomyces sp. NPDC088752]|uniref:hypothetical protein n=1 Tax=Streptomyces sp. NPDC088752 TaxID=3154963 RepID=UPI00341DC9BF
MTTFTPSFRRVATLSRDQVLVPLIENAVQQCAFPKSFSVTFEAYTATREPDGWFHPSTHPTMDARRLYYYLAHPEQWTEDEFPYGARMSVLMGSAMHDIVQHVMTKMGLLIPPKGTCVACGRPHGKGKGKCNEWGVRDDLLGRRGHMDGLLDLPGWGESGDGIFDLKTCAPPVIRGIQSHDLDTFKIKWPKYYAQAQEYMALTGKVQTLILFLAMSEGWDMREFTIPRDDFFIARMEAKYRVVRQHVEMGTPPPVACCSTRAAARKCPASACSVKIGFTS